MSNCFCFRNYKCLSCERAENATDQKAERKVSECGTRAGYNRHLRMKEPTCDLCRHAQTESVKEFNRGKVA